MITQNELEYVEDCETIDRSLGEKMKNNFASP